MDMNLGLGGAAISQVPACRQKSSPRLLARASLSLHVLSVKWGIKKTWHTQKNSPNHPIGANISYDITHTWLNAWQWTAFVHWTKWKVHLFLLFFLILFVLFYWESGWAGWTPEVSPGHLASAGITPDFVIAVLFCRPRLPGESIPFKYKALRCASSAVKRSEEEAAKRAGVARWELASVKVLDCRVPVKQAETFRWEGTQVLQGPVEWS